MAQHYITTIATALADYDNNQHTQTFYESLAWIGLMDTVAWNLLSSSEQTAIQQTILDAIQNEPYD